MATISVARAGDRYRVTIAGGLSAKDLKRLEHVCRVALQHEHVPVDLNVERVTAIDASARMYLERLRVRGASLRGASALGIGDAQADAAPGMPDAIFPGGGSHDAKSVHRRLREPAGCRAVAARSRQ